MVKFGTIRETAREPARAPDLQATPLSVKVQVERFSFYYGDVRVLHEITLGFPRNQVTALIGPSGCGKTTLLRAINRMNDLIPDTRAEGRILLDGENIYDPQVDVVRLRRRVGMVFQRSNPFPKTIFENVAYGLRVNGLVRNRRELQERVEESLRQAALWDEVKDRLHESALTLSGGQQQMLALGMALMTRPSILLMDEPCTGLAPIIVKSVLESLRRINETSGTTIVIVEQNVQATLREVERALVLKTGRLIFDGPSAELAAKEDLWEWF